VYFRTINGGNYFAVCRSNNVETAVDSGIAPALDTFLFFQVIVNANATSADLNLYNASGTQIFTTTITTNIPTGAGRQVGHGTRIVRSSATAVDHGLLHDTFFFNYIFPSPLPF
jgi:hypothetical protein